MKQLLIVLPSLLLFMSCSKKFSDTKQKNLSIKSTEEISDHIVITADDLEPSVLMLCMATPHATDQGMPTATFINVSHPMDNRVNAGGGPSHTYTRMRGPGGGEEDGIRPIPSWWIMTIMTTTNT